MTSLFRDPDVAPTPDSIRAALGPAAGAWERLTRLVTGSGAEVAWRYYRDGGWLARAARGRKTVAWLSVVPGCARITFYFTERDRAALAGHAALPADLRARIATAALIGRLLPVTVEVRDDSALAEVGALIAAKQARST